MVVLHSRAIWGAFNVEYLMSEMPHASYKHILIGPKVVLCQVGHDWCMKRFGEFLL